MSNTDQRSLSLEDLMPFQPTAERPVRVILRQMTARIEVAFHHHPWRQAVFSDAGILQVTTEKASFVVPPQHAVLIPANVAHSAVLLNKTRLFSVYVHFLDDEKPALRRFWDQCKAIKVTPLLLELVRRLSDGALPQIDIARYQALCSITLAELQDSLEVMIGVSLPMEHRLRILCEIFLKTPQQGQLLPELAKRSGLSVSTASRLFRDELGMSFSQWRQQALIARALTLSAQGTPIQLIAEELGYSSASAFTAMVTRALGKSPRDFFRSCGKVP